MTVSVSFVFLLDIHDSVPMKGIPTQNTVKLSQGFSNEPKKFQRTLAKREGGAKLLGKIVLYYLRMACHTVGCDPVNYGPEICGEEICGAGTTH